MSMPVVTVSQSERYWLNIVISIYKPNGEGDGVKGREADSVLWVSHRFSLKVWVPNITHSRAWKR